MDPPGQIPVSYRVPDSAPGSASTPTRRKMHSRSGHGAAHVSKDPILELMMCNLMERQSVSNSGETKASIPSPQVITHQPFPSSTATALDLSSAPPARNCCCRLWQRLWFKITLAVFVLIAIVLAIALPIGLRNASASGAAGNTRRQMQPPQQALGPRLDTSGMSLVFAEDFTAFDSATWNYDIGDGQDYGLQSWGNNELQCYTTSPNNLDVIPHPDYPEDDGILRIRPAYSAVPLPCVNRRAPDSTRQWTSAKIDTKNKIAFTWAGQQVYKGPFMGPPLTEPAPAASNSTRRALLQEGTGGTASSTCGSVVVESRMQLPVAAGRWSALWAMPQPQPCPRSSRAFECGAFGPWPASGEIDIVEQVNTDTEVLGTIHYADRLGFHQYQGGSLALSEQALLEWNIFQLVWNCTSITWYVNTMQVHQITKQSLGNAQWPFDEPFFLIINTAVGGWLTGNVNPDKGPARPMQVDYVRVYAKPSA